MLAVNGKVIDNVTGGRACQPVDEFAGVVFGDQRASIDQGFTEPLALIANPLRQNGSIWSDTPLVCGDDGVI